MRAALVATVLLVLVPLAASQTHEHEGADGVALVLYDGPASGRAVVGGLTHLGFALLKDGVPQVHRNAQIEVRQGGEVLFATPDAHEYDGLFSLDLVFARPGPYEVFATSEGMATGRFAGEVVLPVNASVATIHLDRVEGPASPGDGVLYELAIVDEAGALLDHTDAIVTVRKAGSLRLVDREHLHIHDEPIRFVEVFPEPGDYVLEVTAYKAFATGRSPDVAAVFATFEATAAAGVEAGFGGLVDPASMPAPPLDALTSPAGPTASADGLTLHGMVDPQATVGLGNPVRIAAILLDQAGHPVPHVDFEASVVGPTGAYRSSASLHEYDGVYEVVVVPRVVGHHAARLVAIYNDTRIALDVPFEVAPPVLPLSPGPHVVTVQGLDAVVAGAPTEVTFDVRGPGGPLAHSEVDVQVRRPGEAPVYSFKLHTHDSGTTTATLVLPSEGEWEVFVDPTPLEAQPVLVDPARVAFTVAASLGGDALAPLGEEAAPAAIPAPGLALLIAVAAALALVRRK